MVGNGLFIEISHSFKIRILILSYPWASLGPNFLIILLTCSTEKSVDYCVNQWAMCKFKNGLPRQSKFTIYKSFISSHLDFGDIISDHSL